MVSFDRRRFVAISAAAALTARLGAFAEAIAPATRTLTLRPDRPGIKIPEDFIGLSYEIQMLSDPSFFAPSNTGLVARFRALAPLGVLRLGGNSSDVGWWKPTPGSRQPPLASNVTLVTRPGRRPPMDFTYPITPEGVRNLRGFLDATGWTTIFGINLGTNTPGHAADEAAFVATTLGSRLQYFQIGNEPDAFKHRFRPDTWNADMYFDEWLAIADAIRDRVPDAKFGLPDTAGNAEWSIVVADRWVALRENGRPKITAITHHYYVTGPPSNPNATLTNLLKPHPHILTVAKIVRAAAAKVGASYRMTEGNTCYGGGKPGFSDVYAAALWAADYALKLASLGYAGLNLHGGTPSEIASAMGGIIPGEALIVHPAAVHPIPFYTPIAEMNGKYIAEPVYYGLRFAQYFSGATLVPVDFDSGPINATAYAAKLTDGRSMIAIINKDETQPLSVRVKGLTKGTLQRLNAPALASRQAHLTGYQDGAAEHVYAKDVAALSWNVPATSAALFRAD